MPFIKNLADRAAAGAIAGAALVYGAGKLIGLGASQVRRQ
jgi:hypothetical protein